MKITSPKVIDIFSVKSLKLELFNNDSLISVATGFFYKAPKNSALITNWHVLSGRDPRNGQPLNSHGATPNFIRFWFHLKSPGTVLYGPKTPLYQENGTPIWFQHKEKGQDIDVAMIILTNDFKVEINDQHIEIIQYPVNEQNSEKMLNHHIGADAFVVGYPLGLSVQQILPVWKRASIASEPEVPINELPLFLVDTATREGMSGSPVYARQYGFVHYHDGEGAYLNGSATSFLGVYSGRYGGDDEFAAQLGRVWRRSVIDEIIADPVVGSYQLK